MLGILKPVLTWHKNSAVVHRVALSPLYKKTYGCLRNAAVSGAGGEQTNPCQCAVVGSTDTLSISSKVG